MTAFVQDLRLSLRSIRKSPGFSAAVILTLALGIGANTAIFSLVDAVILRPLPVRNPEQIFFVQALSSRGSDESFPLPFFEQVRDRGRTLAGVSAFDGTRLSARIDGQPEVLWGQCVSGSFFDLLGVAASSGRTLNAGDDRPASPPAAVISHRFWRRRFGMDPAAIGKTMYLKGVPFTIVGVAADGFQGVDPSWSPDLWTPMAQWPALRLKDHDSAGILARLRSGVDPRAADEELDALHRSFRAANPEKGAATPVRIALVPGARGLSDLRDDLSLPLAVLMAVVAAVLLIACANVANLMLARGASRRHEVAVRMAIGAGRGRLLRQMLTESSVYAAAGGAMGFLLVVWAGDALSRLASTTSTASLAVHPDGRILAFTGAVSLLVGLLFGLAPAMRATSTDSSTALRGISSVAGGRRGAGLKRALVLLQVSLSAVLLVAAGLLARSLHELFRVNPGFERERVVVVRAYPTIVGYEGDRERALYSRLQERLGGIPGVTSASLSRFGFLGGRWTRRVSVPETHSAGSEEAAALCYPVSPRFFDTMGVRLIAGRDFDAADGPATARVAVVSESMARARFPRSNAIGRRLRFDDAAGDVEIIGVVRNVRSFSLREPDRPAVYIPISQTPSDLLGQVTIALRTTASAASSSDSIRREIQEIEPDLPLVSSESQAQLAEDSLRTERMMSKLSGGFAILALVLAAVGLYGVVAYEVVTRTREIGIRMAIGAAPSDLARLVLGYGARLVVVGGTVGLIASLAVPRILASLLFGVHAADPWTLAGAALLLATVTLLACYLPARRAMHGDPLAALRSP